MAHCIMRLVTQSVAFVADQGDDHAVEVEEEHQEVEAQLDERFLKCPSVSISGLGARSALNEPSCARSACGKSQ